MHAVVLCVKEVTRDIEFNKISKISIVKAIRLRVEATLSVRVEFSI